MNSLPAVPRNSAPSPRSLRPWDRWARALLLRQLQKLERSELSLVDGDGARRFGGAGEFRTTVTVHAGRFYRDAVFGGSLALAEGYLRGDWDCDDLTAMFRLVLQNSSFSDGMDRGAPQWQLALQRWWHARRANTRRGSKQNIREHYDLGNDFFRLWLDDTMCYSSGIFASGDATMREASLAKIDRLCRKLELQPSDHLLEIGCGWGALAVHAASRYGCRVTATTISDQQYEETRRRIDAAGLHDRVTLLRQDYRDLTGTYDKLVSVEMIEAVGHGFLDTFFEQCGKLLNSTGTMVLQAIVMPDLGYERYLRSVDFIQRYVFPGGCLPSVGAMLDSARRKTDLRLEYVEDFGTHYAETLRRWRSAFVAKLDEVRKLGYPERFVRLWAYYLCYCEAAFDERATGVVQIQFDKPGYRREAATIELTEAGRRSRLSRAAEVAELLLPMGAGSS